MASNVTGWTERVGAGDWDGSEATTIQSQGASDGHGGILTRDATGMLEDFTFITDETASIANGTASNGGMVFCCNATASQYYLVTWTIDWGGGAYVTVQDSALPYNTSVLYSGHTGHELVDGTTYTVKIKFKQSTGVLEMWFGTDYRTYTIASPHAYGHIGYGTPEGWADGTIWEYGSIVDDGTPTPTRSRFYIVS